MNILIACECSGIVREAFRKRGHNAVSCDILPSEIPGPHIQSDVQNHLTSFWDMLIAFPDCTYLCGSGMHWTSRGLRDPQLTENAILFVKDLWNAPIERIAIENSVGVLSTRWRKPDQIIQPYQFGHDASKATCLWLKNLPLLKATKLVSGRLVNGLERWGNQTDSGQNKLPPSDNRWMERARTYSGIAEAMAEQWTNKFPIQEKLTLI